MLPAHALALTKILSSAVKRAKNQSTFHDNIGIESIHRNLHLAYINMQVTLIKRALLRL
jgi:hypothetical protein